MPQRPSRTLAESLARRYRSLELTRQRIEKLVGDGEISLRAAEHMYEGLFLSTFTAFETFVEELFVGLLVSNAGLYSETADVVPRFTIRSHIVARDLVIGAGRQYVDWLPSERTEERANVFFRGGRPFTLLRDPTMANVLAVLGRGTIVRNAIAHKSRYSLHRFELNVIRGTALPPRERTPAGFLRGVGAGAPVETRYETYATGILTVARSLAS